MVQESLERRRAVAQRMQEAREAQLALQSLRQQVLPDGRLLGDADHDGTLFDILQALQPVVRRHGNFRLDLTTGDNLRLRITNVAGDLGVQVVSDRRRSDAPEAEADVIDLRSGREAVRLAPAREPEPAPVAPRTPLLDLTQETDDGSALSAALRRQKGEG